MIIVLISPSIPIQKEMISEIKKNYFYSSRICSQHKIISVVQENQFFSLFCFQYNNSLKIIDNVDIKL